MNYLPSDQIGKPFFKNIIRTLEANNYIPKHLIYDTTTLLNISTFYFQRDEIQKAFKIIDFGYSIYKSDQYIIQRCRIYILMKQYENALSELNTLKDKSSLNALYQQFKLSILTNNEENTQMYVDKILEICTSKVDIYIQFTIFFTKHKFTQFAKECWDAVCRHNPKKNALNYRIAKLAFNFEIKDYETAYHLSLNLNRCYPDHLVVLYYFTFLCLMTNRLSKAATLIRYLKGIDSSNMITHQLDTILGEKQLERYKKRNS